MQFSNGIHISEILNLPTIYSKLMSKSGFDWIHDISATLYISIYNQRNKRNHFFCLNAKEYNELAKWAIENPDYNYAQENSDAAGWYARFLKLMGLSPETET